MHDELSTVHIMPSLNSKQQCRWHNYSTISELEQATVQSILYAAQQAIKQRGGFRIVLAGGTTPRRVYESLRKADADWATWHVYFGDERCLPPDHAERNSRMAASAWLDHVAIPAEQIHPMPAELGAEAAASSYTQTVNGIEQFDLVLLGLGEDGHTASLFPNHEWGNTPDSPAAISVHDAPKPPPDRVSLSAHRLNATHQLMFLVTGESKRQAVKDWRNGVNIPAAAIAPASGADVYIEAALLKG
jgi:6-phosphogluconolactonase